MNWIARTLPTVQGRIVSGVASIAAAALATLGMMKPGITSVERAALIVPLIAAIVTWLFAEISGANVAHPHDVELFKRIFDLISEDERRFLRGHDFGNSFNLLQIKGVREIDHWQGSSCEFLNRDLQKRWMKVKADIGAFRDLVAQTTSGAHGSPGMQSVYPRFVDPEDPPLKVKLEIQALNKAAASVSEALNAFEPAARRRLFV